MAGRNAEYSKARKAKFRAEGRCYQCGDKLSDDGYKSCKKCRELIRNANHRYKERHPGYEYGKGVSEEDLKFFETVKPTKKIKYKIDELAIMSRERGISYGYLVAELEMAQQVQGRDSLS